MTYSTNDAYGTFAMIWPPVHAGSFLLLAFCSVCDNLKGRKLMILDIFCLWICLFLASVYNSKHYSLFQAPFLLFCGEVHL